MPKWNPIQRAAKPIVDGVDPKARGLLNVRIPLNQTPPDEWAEAFERGYDATVSLSMHPPRVVGNEIHIRPPDAEIEEYVRYVDERIAAANTFFETKVYPSVRAAEKDQQRAEEEVSRRLRDARSRLERL